MSLAAAIIRLHVAAGALWTLLSLAIAVRRRAGLPLFALQMAAALTTLLAGIALWALLHKGGMGPSEHWLVLGTFSAFLALGLQLGLAASAAGNVRFAGGSLALAWAGVALLTVAAAAMIGSRFV